MTNKDSKLEKGASRNETPVTTHPWQMPQIEYAAHQGVLGGTYSPPREVTDRIKTLIEKERQAP